MKKMIQVLILLLVFSNLSFSKSLAQDVLVPQPPEQTEQLDRDFILFPKMEENMQASIRSAKQVASTTGKAIKLDEASVSELISIIDRMSNYFVAYATYAQAMKDSVYKCSQDQSLPTAQFKKCNQDYQVYSTIYSVHTKRAKEFATTKNQILSAQQFIDAAASSYLNSMKSITVSCIKGKSVKKVTGSNPKCPAGYKVKK